MKNILMGLDEQDHQLLHTLKKENNPLLKGGVKKFCEKAISKAIKQIREQRVNQEKWHGVMLTDMISFFEISDPETIKDVEKWIESVGIQHGEKYVVTQYWGYKKSKGKKDHGNIYEYMERLWNIQNWHVNFLRKK